MNLRLPIALASLLAAFACGPPASPEIVSIEYLRAMYSGNSDGAIACIDIDEVVERIEEEISLVATDGESESFLRDSVTTLLWGLFQQTPREEYTYDAVPKSDNGDRVRVAVTLRDGDGGSSTRSMDLHRTNAGWRISGESLDPLVRYVIQRLEERY